jgi:hypothetical protein
VPTEIWNEYIRQLAIFNRRNTILFSALSGSLTPQLRSRIQALGTAREVWTFLGTMCAPPGVTQAIQRFSALHTITLAVCLGSVDLYAQRLETAWKSYNQASLPPISALRVVEPRLAHEQYAPFLPGGDSTAGDGSGQQQQQQQQQSLRFPESALCMLFLHNLGPDNKDLTERLCKDYNVGGFGQGPLVGFQDLVLVTKRAFETQQ